MLRLKRNPWRLHLICSFNLKALNKMSPWLTEAREEGRERQGRERERMDVETGEREREFTDVFT